MRNRWRWSFNVLGGLGFATAHHRRYGPHRDRASRLVVLAVLCIALLLIVAVALIVWLVKRRHRRSAAVVWRGGVSPMSDQIIDFSIENGYK